MKKLLGILVLGLLWCNFALALNLPKDVESGNAYKKSLDEKYKKYENLTELIPFKLQQLMLVYKLDHVDLKSFRSRNFSKDIQLILI